MKKPVRESEIEIIELMVPTYANFGGKVHGGILLSLMDKVAYVCASRFSSKYCVTVSVEGVDFLHPVEVGQLVSFKASVNYVGNSTMIVGIRVEATDTRSGATYHTNSSYFTMAAKEDDGRLSTVPQLILENETQLRRFCEGKAIKLFGRRKRDILKSDLQQFSVNDLKGQVEKERCQICF